MNGPGTFASFSPGFPRSCVTHQVCDFNQLPSQVLGHLVRTVGDHPDAHPIALAVGCAMHAMKRQTLVHLSSTLLSLFRRLRTHYGMSDLSQLRDRELWTRFVTGRTLSAGEVRMLTA